MTKNKTLAAIAGLKDSPEWEEFVLLAKSDGTQAGLFKKMLEIYKGSIKKESDDRRIGFYTCPACNGQCYIYSIGISIFSKIECCGCGLETIVSEIYHHVGFKDHYVDVVIKDKDDIQYKIKIYFNK